MPKTILSVDDDKQIRDLIQTYLEGKGYRVITSVDGWDCLREIIVKKPDLILMDVNMPKLDGLNTLDMIKMTRIDNHIPIILVSGEGDRETITKAAKLGADDFLVKPFSFEELGARPAVQRGMAVGADLSVDNTKLPPEEQARIRKMLYNQRARPVPA